jgi:aldehyde dehydrogenase (NAD+)
LQVDKIEDSIEFISSRPKPLALYVFSKNKTLQNRMISETSSGSVTFNDAILQVLTDNHFLQFDFHLLNYISVQIHNNLMRIICWLQYAADSLPFGGVGASGFGMYHGKFSFDTFSHQKAIVRRSFLTDFWYRYPPWTANKFQLLEVSYNYDYLGLVLVILGLKRPSKRQIIPC